MPVAQRTAARQSRQQSRERIVTAAAVLVRRQGYAGLSVDAVMREAGFGRTIFYRHFDDIADLLLRAGRDAIADLYQAQRAFRETRMDDGPDVIRMAMEPAVTVYQRHGPLLRAIAEGAARDEQIAASQQAVREPFNEFVEEGLRALPCLAAHPPADFAETARALNLMNESYLLDAFGGEPRVSAEQAIQTLSEIWSAVIHRSDGVDRP